MDATGRFVRSRAGDLRILHRPDIAPEHVVRAIEAHRANARRGREFCEHCGPASSVSRIAIRREEGDLDLAVKWNHARGWRRAIREWLRGSRAARATKGEAQLREVGILHPETFAFAERRAPGRVLESFLLTGFLAGSSPLPALMPQLLAEPRRRRAVAYAIGRAIGALHAAGLDHRDLKHSNLLVTADDQVALLDLDSLVPPRRPTWRRRVRALGQLEAFASDLYPSLPRTDRARVLRGYFEREPSLRARRSELVRDVRAWVERRLTRWEGRDRALHIYYPLAPRPPLPPTILDMRNAARRSGSAAGAETGRCA
jgi:tRNA A-37 threonylcarbamoyl transferase component Bud32